MNKVDVHFDIDNAYLQEFKSLGRPYCISQFFSGNNLRLTYNPGTPDEPQSVQSLLLLKFSWALEPLELL